MYVVHHNHTSYLSHTHIHTHTHTHTQTPLHTHTHTHTLTHNSHTPIPHIDMERSDVLDLEAARPPALSVVKVTYAQQLVVVYPRPMKRGATLRQDR